MTVLLCEQKGELSWPQSIPECYQKGLNFQFFKKAEIVAYKQACTHFTHTSMHTGPGRTLFYNNASLYLSLYTWES